VLLILFGLLSDGENLCHFCAISLHKLAIIGEMQKP